VLRFFFVLNVDDATKVVQNVVSLHAEEVMKLVKEQEGGLGSEECHALRSTRTFSAAARSG
jgi:hypothetical protein